MPLTQYWNGKLYIKPTAASTVDVSAMVSATLTVSGVVGLVGYSDDGEPLTLHRIEGTNPNRAKALFQSGDMLEATRIVFNPTTDENIQGGAQRIYAVVVNPHTQASIYNRSTWPGTLLMTMGDRSIKLTSKKYGLSGNSIHRTVTSALTGVGITVELYGDSEASGVIGNDTVMSFTAPTVCTFDTVAVQMYRNNMATMASSSLGDTEVSQWLDEYAAALADNTAIVFLYGEQGITLAAPWGGTFPADLQVKSSNAGDTGEVEIVGVDAEGEVIRWFGNLNGTSDVLVQDGDGVDYTFAAVCSIKKTGVGTIAGTVTLETQAVVYPSAPEATVITVAPSASSAGIALTKIGTAGAVKAPFGGIIEFTDADYASSSCVIEGINGDGERVFERVEIDDENKGVSTNTEIEYLTAIHYAACGSVTATMVLYAQNSAGAVNTVYKLIEDYEGKTGMELESELANKTSFAWYNCDYNLAPVDVAAGSNLVDAAWTYKAKTYALVDWINNNSQYVSAERKWGEALLNPVLTGVMSGFYYPGAESNAYLSGAVDGRGDAAFSDWQTALDLLQRVRCNIVVPLISEDDTAAAVTIDESAVFAAVATHCAELSGTNERHAFVGYKATTKTLLYSAVRALNTRHVQLCSQRIAKYDVEGAYTEFPEWSMACCFAGMRAGASVGMPLTNKYISATAVTWENDDYLTTGWHPLYDADELIEKGVMFVEEDTEAGAWKIVKDRTTYMQQDVDVFTQGAMNAAVDYFVYNWREALKRRFLGKKTITSIPREAEAYSVTIFEQMRGQDVIVDGTVDGETVNAWQNVTFSLVANAMSAEGQFMFVNSVDFIFVTIHPIPVTLT